MTTPNPGQVSEPVSPIESEAPDFTPTSLEASQKATDNTDTPSFIRGSSDSRIELAGEPQVQQSTGTHPIDTRPTGPESTNTEPTVDTVTQLDETPAAARTDIHDKPPQYESYPEVYYVENAQDNQLPQVVYDRSFPQVSYGSHPEAYNQEGCTLEALRQRKGRKTCGLRKKWLWAVLATVIGVVIVAAIVGGVVGSRSRNSKKGTSFMPTTALAAVNYTETTGVQHRRVYFQADDRSLYQSAWDSNSQKWDVSPLNPNNSPGPEIKPGTPLAAYVYNDQSHSTLEFHVFFLDTENKIWERGTPNADDMWGSQVSNVLAGNYTTSNDSDIAVYAVGCEDWCASTSVIVWQSAEGELWFSGFITNYGWWAHEAGVDADHPLLSGSSLSLVPIWGNQSDGALLSVYASTGNLSRFVFNTTEKWENGWTYDGHFTGGLDPDATITSFSQGYTGGNNTSSDIEVLATKPGVPGGGASLWDSEFSAHDLFNNTNTSSLSSISNYSSIAATGAGGVYAVEGDQLIEWQWQHSSRSFKKIGIVKTDI